MLTCRKDDDYVIGHRNRSTFNFERNIAFSDDRQRIRIITRDSRGRWIDECEVIIKDKKIGLYMPSSYNLHFTNPRDSRATIDWEVIEQEKDGEIHKIPNIKIDYITNLQNIGSLHFIGEEDIRIGKELKVSIPLSNGLNIEYKEIGGKKNIIIEFWK